MNISTAQLSTNETQTIGANLFLKFTLLIRFQDCFFKISKWR